jgi:hypothetical protein
MSDLIRSLVAWEADTASLEVAFAGPDADCLTSARPSLRSSARHGMSGIEANASTAMIRLAALQNDLKQQSNRSLHRYMA